MKTYLISEEVLEQLLEVIQGCDYERTGVQQADEALRALLAKEPSEPNIFRHECDCGCPCDCYGPSTAKHQLRDFLQGQTK
jgi:hypothetical protein